jgi:hypothetical protein
MLMLKGIITLQGDPNLLVVPWMAAKILGSRE